MPTFAQEMAELMASVDKGIRTFKKRPPDLLFPKAATPIN